MEDLAAIPAVVDRLRDDPPTSLGGLAVEQVDDLSLGSADVPPTNGLRFTLADQGRVVVRPSGTEPKIKCYLEVVVPVERRPRTVSTPPASPPSAASTPSAPTSAPQRDSEFPQLGTFGPRNPARCTRRWITRSRWVGCET